MNQQEEQQTPPAGMVEVPTQFTLFQPYTHISVTPEGLALSHYLAPGFAVSYALGPENVARIRDEWNRIEAEQAKQQKEEMPRPPLGLILPNRRVD